MCLQDSAGTSQPETMNAGISCTAISRVQNTDYKQTINSSLIYCSSAGLVLKTVDTGCSVKCTKPNEVTGNHHLQ